MVVFLLAIALAMDSFAMSLVLGTNIKGKNSIRSKLFIALCFGFFQGAMFFIGDLVGVVLSQFFITFITYISFILLLLVAISMFKEYLDIGKKEEEKQPNIVYLSFLTSIDAIITGVGASGYDLNGIYTSLVICLVTMLFVICGLYISTYLKKIKIVEKNALLLGCLIILYLAFKLII